MKKSDISKDFDPKTLFLFALPSMMMVLFESTYSVIDGLFVANFVGKEALSSINIIIPMLLFFMGLGTMIGIGGSALISKKLGENRVDEARCDFTLLGVFLVGLSLFEIVVGYIFVDEILLFLGATPTLFGYAKSYFLIILFGLPIFLSQFLFQSFFIVAGRPKLGLYSIVGAGLFHIILDYVYIVWLNMGISGAALASICSSLIPAIVGIVFFASKKSELYFVMPKWNFKTIWRSCFNGLAEMVGIMAVGCIAFVFNHTMIDLVGEIGVAAITVILYIEYAFNSIFFGYSIGVVPIFAYNFGAKNHDRLKRVFKMCVIFILSLSVFMVLCSLTLAPFIIKIFSNNDIEFYELALTGFLIYAFKYFFAGINIFTAAMFTAYSNGKIAAIISSIRSFILVVPMIIILPKFFGLKGIWFAVPIAEAIAFILSVALIFYARKRYKYL
ncbi:MAG: MATE family efflux transporter [Campylobacteraceae bacterium]|jgi:putative MATE family efflux protein|nr:MATE family efflux transporter [Campylobacteraceae bacterium]